MGRVQRLNGAMATRFMPKSIFFGTGIWISRPGFRLGGGPGRDRRPLQAPGPIQIDPGCDSEPGGAGNASRSSTATRFLENRRLAGSVRFRHAGLSWTCTPQSVQQEPGGRRALGAGRRAPGREVRGKCQNPAPTHTHALTHRQDCYPALWEDKRKPRKALSCSVQRGRVRALGMSPKGHGTYCRAHCAMLAFVGIC